ncbi:MAG: hypothetical protein ABIO24_14665 [Saprospiraceae bacterium]
MKLIFFSLLLALAFTHCAGPATAPTRNLECYVRFDAARQQVQADATLHRGTDPQAAPIEMPGGLLYQATEMRILPVQGLSYRRTYAASYVPEHAFSWTDEKGQRQRAVFTMAAIPTFSFGDQPLSRDKTATLRWEGGALEKGEGLVLMWEKKARNETVPMEIIRSSGEPFIEFPAAKIAELAPGEWTLYVVRKRLAKTEVGGMPVQAVLEYYSKSDTIEVK